MTTAPTPLAAEPPGSPLAHCVLCGHGGDHGGQPHSLVLLDGHTQASAPPFITTSAHDDDLLTPEVVNLILQAGGDVHWTQPEGWVIQVPYLSALGRYQQLVEGAR